MSTMSGILLLSLVIAAGQAPVGQDTVDAFRALLKAKQLDELDARVAALDPDDPAWERLPSVVYSAGIARSDVPSVITRLRRVIERTSKPLHKASALVVIGRAHRRQGDDAAAIRALQDAKAASPDSPFAEEATGLIYEIEHLSPGLAAPAIDTRSRSGRRVALAALRGKAVVLVFWGST